MNETYAKDQNMRLLQNENRELKVQIDSLEQSIIDFNRIIQEFQEKIALQDKDIKHHQYEYEALKFHNKQLCKRVELLQNDLNGHTPFKNHRSHSMNHETKKENDKFSSFINISKKQLENEDFLNLLNRELQEKIQINQKLNSDIQVIEEIYIDKICKLDDELTKLKRENIDSKTTAGKSVANNMTNHFLNHKSIIDNKYVLTYFFKLMQSISLNLIYNFIQNYKLLQISNDINNKYSPTIIDFTSNLLLPKELELSVKSLEKLTQIILFPGKINELLIETLSQHSLNPIDKPQHIQNNSQNLQNLSSSFSVISSLVSEADTNKFDENNNLKSLINNTVISPTTNNDILIMNIALFFVKLSEDMLLSSKFDNKLIKNVSNGPERCFDILLNALNIFIQKFFGESPINDNFITNPIETYASQIKFLELNRDIAKWLSKEDVNCDRTKEESKFNAKRATYVAYFLIFARKLHDSIDYLATKSKSLTGPEPNADYWLSLGTALTKEFDSVKEDIFNTIFRELYRKEETTLAHFKGKILARDKRLMQFYDQERKIIEEDLAYHKSRFVYVMDEMSAMDHRMICVLNQKDIADIELAKSLQEIAKLNEDINTIKKNYEDQLSAMSDHVCALNDKLEAFTS
ncbi:unnamed protein product [Gordionus sp. m RMFG-2023]|uniref:uncharacterized protein LOC135931903 n=1 Tax=Gordionus sp. m RMFG-2023 TaxID=3053472 RepID=UPI0030E2D1B6